MEHLPQEETATDVPELPEETHARALDETPPEDLKLPRAIADAVAAIAIARCEVEAAVVSFDCSSQDGGNATVVGRAGTAPEQGLERVAYLPLLVGDYARGAVALYDRRGPLDSDQLQILETVQELASLILRQRRMLEEVSAEANNLRHLVDASTYRERLALAVAAAPTLEDALASVLPTICAHDGWDYAQLWRVSSHRAALECEGGYWHAAHSSDPVQQRSVDNFHFSSQQLLLPQGTGQPGRSWASHESGWNSHNPDDDPAGLAHERAIRSTGFQTQLTFPVHAGNQVAGVVELLSFDRKVEDRDTRQLVAMLSRTLSEALLKELHHTFESRYNSLTHLPNEEHFRKLLEGAFHLARMQGSAFAVLRMNIENLRNVNNGFGMSKGNTLILTVAERLKLQLGEGDILGHYGGGNFALGILVESDHDAFSRAHDALCAIRTELDLSDLGMDPLSIHGHVGLSIFPRDGEAVDIIVRNANNAHDQAMEIGKNSIIPFDFNMHAEAQKLIRIENELRRAIERRELSVLYQPQVSLETGLVTGTEALLRWHHPEMGDISPVEFIPIAERGELIQEIGTWVLERSCEATTALQCEGTPLTLSVNLSPYEFQHADLLRTITSVLRRTKLDPASLQLEITETAAIQDLAYAIRTLGALQDLGVRIAIDDFGTGHSSLSQLQHLPIDVVKIDQSFIRGMLEHEKVRGIVQSIIDLARNLRLSTVAEGVETAKQAAMLREMGCEKAQGFHYGRPQSLADLRTMLRPSPEGGTVH